MIDFLLLNGIINWWIAFSGASWHFLLVEINWMSIRICLGSELMEIPKRTPPETHPGYIKWECGPKDLSVRPDPPDHSGGMLFTTYTQPQSLVCLNVNIMQASATQFWKSTKLEHFKSFYIRRTGKWRNTLRSTAVFVLWRSASHGSDQRQLLSHSAMTPWGTQ